jgi:acyl-CoA thioesterase
VLALLDSLPPPVLALFDEPRGAASVDFTADLHVPLPRPGAVAGAHHLVVASSDHGDGGTTEERADVWAEDGTHLATVRQLVTIL